MDTYEVFREAIRNKQQVICTYNGLRREVCPHVLGTKNGKQQVLTFQFAGQSNNGLPLGGQWRCFELDKVKEASARDGKWHTGDSHLKPQVCVSEIDIEVAY